MAFVKATQEEIDQYLSQRKPDQQDAGKFVKASQEEIDAYKANVQKKSIVSKDLTNRLFKESKPDDSLFQEITGQRKQQQQQQMPWEDGETNLASRILQRSPVAAVEGFMSLLDTPLALSDLVWGPIFGHRTEDERLFGEYQDALTKFDEATGGRTIPQTGVERFAESISRSAGASAPFGVVGAGGSIAGNTIKEVGIGALFGIGEQLATEAGIENPWLKMGIGMATALSPKAIGAASRRAGNFARNMREDFRAGGREPAGTPRFLTESGTEAAIADARLSKDKMAARIAETSEEAVADFERSMGSLEESVLERLAPLDAEATEQAMKTAEKASALDSVAPPPASNAEGWAQVQRGVRTAEKESAALHQTAYNEVRKATNKVPLEVKSIMQEARTIRGKLRQVISKVKSASEKEALRYVEDIVEKFGPVRQSTGLFDASGQIIYTMKYPEITVAEAIATKQSLNRMFGDPDLKGIKNIVKPMRKAYNNDIYSSLGDLPQVRDRFGEAEKLYTEYAEKFKNKNISKFTNRKLDPERGAEIFDSPTATRQIMDVVQGTPSQNLTERLVVDSIASKDLTNARRLADESRAYISQQGNNALRDLISLRDPASAVGARGAARAQIMKDVSAVQTAKAYPNYTMSLMNTRNGRNVVKDSLGNSQNGKRIYRQLSEQKAKDLMSSILDADKKIDFKKVRKMLSNNETREMIRDIMGQDGVNFFGRLETYATNLSRNMDILARKHPSFFDKITSQAKKSWVKLALAPLVVVAPGKAVAAVAAAALVKRMKHGQLVRMIENPQSRNAIKNMASTNGRDPIRMMNYLKQLGLAIQEGENQDES